MVKQSTILKGDQRDYTISNIATIALFLLIALLEVLFSLRNNLFFAGVTIVVIFLVQCASILLLRKNQNRYLNPQNVFFVTTAALFYLCILSGFSNGIYLYYFPAAMVYFLNSANTSNNKRFKSFIIITVLFISALAVSYALFPPLVSIPLENNLLSYRFFGAVILTAILVKDLFVLQAYLQNTDGRKEYHQALFQSYLDAYIIFNQETKEVIDYNKRMLSLFELEPETDLKQLYFTQVMMRYLAEDSVNKELMMDNIPDNWHGEATFITHQKEKFFSYVQSVVYYRDNIKYQILSIRDINSLKDAEKKVMIYKESVEKAGRAKARFLSSMSHELRTPLNGIIGTSNLIKSEANLPEATQKHIDVLLYSSEHMLGIINDILDFSKIDAGKLELKKQAFNIQQCIDGLVKSFDVQFKHKNLQLVIDQSPLLENVTVLSDEVKLTQVMSNLLSNALKFTLEGNITLGVKIKETNDDNITIQFDVKDTGIGIPEDKRIDIFQGFSQVHAAELSRRFGGTGLGLTISEKLVDLFGGRLEVESELGKGSRFYFTLILETVKKSLPVFEGNPIIENNIDIRGIRILVVEDNLINATILKSFLKKWEIQIKEAENGLHALEMLKFHQFDLILMDLEMPEMDGYTAIKIIRQTDSETPILAFTASLLENMDEVLAEAGFNGYVLKPFRPAELKEKIEMYAPRRKIAYV